MGTKSAGHLPAPAHSTGPDLASGTACRGEKRIRRTGENFKTRSTTFLPLNRRTHPRSLAALASLQSALPVVALLLVASNGPTCLHQGLELGTLAMKQ